MKKCKFCKKILERKKGESLGNWKLRKFCNHKCFYKSKVKPFTISSKGYKLVFKPEHLLASKAGYVPEHRLVVMEHHKILLKDDQVVHHINGNKQDNRIENLQIINRSDIGKIEKINIQCPNCNYKFYAA